MLNSTSGYLLSNHSRTHHCSYVYETILQSPKNLSSTIETDHTRVGMPTVPLTRLLFVAWHVEQRDIKEGGSILHLIRSLINLVPPLWRNTFPSSTLPPFTLDAAILAKGQYTPLFLPIDRPHTLQSSLLCFPLLRPAPLREPHIQRKCKYTWLRDKYNSFLIWNVSIIECKDTLQKNRKNWILIMLIKIYI